MANGIRIDPFATQRGLQFGQQLRSGIDLRKEKKAEAERQAALQQRLAGLQSAAFPGAQPGLQAGGQPQVAPQQPAPQAGLQQPQAAPQAAPQQTQAQALAQLAIEFPERFKQISESQGIITTQQKQEAVSFGTKFLNTPAPQRQALIDQRIQAVTARGGDASDTAELAGLSEQEQNQAVTASMIAALPIAEQVKIARGEGFDLTAGQREFAGLTEGLTEEQTNEAKLIKLGLSPRAVGSAIQTISAKDIAEEIGDAEATIAERKKFGDLTGASRSKAIDDGVDRIGKIDIGIQNIDSAIQAVNDGAGTGAIERLFPSIKAASVELDNIQGRMALDVIGAVTFGALSKGELDLAKLVALPTGLDGPQLIEHLEAKKVAQLKLRNYFREQIDFLDQGGSVAGFLRERERQQAPEATAGAATQPELAEGAIIRNPQTGQRQQVVNGQLVNI